MKCIGAIVNVCAICDVVYYVDAFLALLYENTKVSNYYNGNSQTNWLNEKKYAKKYLLKIFTIKTH